ncbi:ABC transporter ATP-binding protein [Amnibacterium flavum]|uniref:Peptide ABC transporter ATP-binding protein n=1 Tax=Amnibacterium flavum TaxID=2173173 RepID=A0A2V1HV02_9MICO|nr:ATP-binding cassette domain-containing protein [Amnibacterium flavum]PVZ94137.1 peptide ABC transporter ATP-binding protein [Amnibacterium flavum]
MALLEIDDLRKRYRTGRHVVDALAGVSASVDAGRTLAVVGESGSGKSTLGSIVAGLQRPSGGSLTFEGQPIGGRVYRGELRRRIQMVFQSPFQSLDPKFRVEATLMEPLTLLSGLSRREASIRVDELLDLVHLPRELRRRRPAELSGGQQQRVAIARALAPNPDLVVLDEPTSGLDQSVRGRIVGLLKELQAERDVAYIFITHDIDVARAIAHEVIVMQRGEVVEAGDRSVLESPRHQYTRALLAAVPVMDPGRRRSGARSGAPAPTVTIEES